MAKTVLITGCSSGVGHETAHAFMNEGWTVYATARDTDDIAELEAAGCEIESLDVTDESEISAVVSRVLDDAGHIDCLVNNAGYGQFGPVEDVPTQLVEAQFDVNVYGPHRLMRAVLPHLRERGDGTIINVSSVAGEVTVPGMGTYSGSKHALGAISDALRTEVDAHGIDVVLIEPGPVATSFAERANDEIDKLDSSEAYDTIYRFYEDSEVFGGQTPVAVSPESVAETILEAAVSPAPKARYSVGPFGSVALKTRFLPDSLTDTIYRQLLRLL